MLTVYRQSASYYSTQIVAHAYLNNAAILYNGKKKTVLDSKTPTDDYRKNFIWPMFRKQKKWIVCSIDLTAGTVRTIYN